MECGWSNFVIILDVLLGWFICKCVDVLGNSSSYIEKGTLKYGMGECKKEPVGSH